MGELDLQGIVMVQELPNDEQNTSVDERRLSTNPPFDRDEAFGYEGAYLVIDDQTMPGIADSSEILEILKAQTTSTMKTKK